MQRNEDMFVGTWVSFQPFDSDDYLVEYTITKLGNLYQVTAKDLQDDEHMEISNVRLDGHTLEFASLMPSTGREGINRFKVKNDNTLISEFTFRVTEALKRIVPE